MYRDLIETFHMTPPVLSALVEHGSCKGNVKIRPSARIASTYDATPLGFSLETVGAGGVIFLAEERKEKML